MARVESHAGEHDKPKNAVIREAVDKHVPGGDDRGPKDNHLRETWQWLQERADDRNRIDSQVAISELAQTLSMKEKFVKSSRLKPLEREGWIQPNFNYIEVLDRD